MGTTRWWPPGIALQKRRFSKKDGKKEEKSLPYCKNVVNISALQKMPLKCPQLSTMDSLLISDKIGFDFAGDHV